MAQLFSQLETHGSNGKILADALEDNGNVDYLRHLPLNVNDSDYSDSEVTIHLMDLVQSIKLHTH